MKINFGLEIECEYDEGKMHVDKGAYHEGISFSKFWDASGDSSLSSCKFVRGRTCEFVSKKFNEDELETICNDFKKEIMTRSRKKEMEEIIALNPTCGLHVHFSHPCIDSLYVIHPLFFRRARSMFLKNVEKKYPHLYAKIRKHYFREFSQPKWEEFHHHRNSEFNLTTDEDGLEWRSINALGAKTWGELFGIIKIAIDSIINTYNIGIENGFEVKHNANMASPRIETEVNAQLSELDSTIRIENLIDDEPIEIEPDGRDAYTRTFSQ